MAVDAPIADAKPLPDIVTASGNNPLAETISASREVFRRDRLALGWRAALRVLHRACPARPAALRPSAHWRSCRKMAYGWPMKYPPRAFRWEPPIWAATSCRS